MNRFSFESLMGRMARAVTERDLDGIAACFTSDAELLAPPDLGVFPGSGPIRGRLELVPAGCRLELHHVWFDHARQVGAVEYTFSPPGIDRAGHGVGIAEIADGLIASWREYRCRGPSSFAEFIDSAGDDRTEPAGIPG